MKYLTFSIISVIFSQGIFAQSFVQPLDNLSPMFGNDAIALDTKGNEIEGKLSGGVMIMGHLKSFTLKIDEGTKRKFKSEEVKLLKIKSSGLVKFMMVTESMSSVKKMSNTDYDEIANKDWLIFEQALINRKKDKPRLLQLLNPGFDSKIKVFVDPTASETGGIGMGGMKITGGEDKSFLLVKNQTKAVKIKKKKYKKEFSNLFGDCDQMNEIFGGSKTKFQDMAGHVYAYDQACN